MDILLSLPFAGIILACAVGLMVWHVRSWRAQQAAGLDAKAMEYHRRQFGRRMQTSATLAVVATALPIGLWVINHWPKVGAFYWGGVVLLVVWLGLLAVADMWATRRYFGDLHHDYRVEQARLESELRRLQAKEGNGKPPQGLPGIDPNVKGKGQS